MRQLERSSWIFGGMALVSDGGKRAPIHLRGWGPLLGFHRHTVGRVIPWSGCVPAEPASVSPSKESLAGIS